jgi:hypothetical protein
LTAVTLGRLGAVAVSTGGAVGVGLCAAAFPVGAPSSLAEHHFFTCSPQKMANRSAIHAKYTPMMPLEAAGVMTSSPVTMAATDSTTAP